MRNSSSNYTVCEVLREINDEHQGDTDHDKMIRNKLALAEIMAKKMSRKLLEYNKDVYKGWWERNPDKAADLARRLEEKYCVGCPDDA